MRIFNKRMAKETTEKKTSQSKILNVEVNERPRICCIDIDDKVINQLTSSGFNIFSGNLGSKIKVPNTSRHDSYQLLLDFNFPANIHEYDIFIIDLDNGKTIDYKKEDHTITNHTGKFAFSFLSTYPETIFDPRPIISEILKSKINQIGKRPHIIITFTTGSYIIEYEPVKITEGYASKQGIEKYNIYSYADNLPLNEPKYGKEMTVCDMRIDLKNLLELNLKKTTYNQTFYHPTVRDNEKIIPDPNYQPLIKNSNEDIVSIVEFKGNSFMFYFPQIESKGDFINTFLTNIAPDILPELFPFSTTFDWKKNEEYWLPNHQKILNEKKSLEKDFEEKIKLKNNEVDQNLKHYSFLHEIITETGDNLVDALIKYLKWLGFKIVIKVDEEVVSTNVLEEDIQVELENGLLIIECKGINGTSTDSDCSQISKIKHRRCKERNRFDVFALYIVNHQRYLPPLNRQNPPFSNNQIQDAVNDERGLLTTWQLFNLYSEIENGILSKESARNILLGFGFIEFRPKNLILIDEPTEIFKNGEVCIINITGIELKISEEILVEKNGKFHKANIVGIQLNDQPVQTAKTGEIGLQLNIPIKKKSILWKKASC